MQIDSKVTFDDSSPSRDHRARTASAASEGASSTSDTPTERPVAGGATPVSKPQQDATRDSTAEGRDAPSISDKPDGRGPRERAERALERMLDMPTGTRLSIDVDFEREEVRFQIRDRETNKIVREIPRDESRSLIEKLREFTGALVDRSL